MLWLGNEETWEDGFVFSFDTLRDAPDVAKDWSKILGKFESWSILDDKGGFTENIRGGPVHRFFKNAEPPDTLRINYSQIFLMWDEENQWINQTVDNIRSDLRGYCVPVFFFRGGQILFLASDESGSITTQRCRRHLRSLAGWCIVDANGETFSAKGRDEQRWDLTELEDLISSD